MQQKPLLISSLIAHADRHHGDTEIVSRTLAGDIHRYTYRDAHGRARQLARALKVLAVGEGDRVATLAWNGYRHFELYYGVSGIGAVLHTINPRLLPEQIAWIANHAEDRLLFFDQTFLPIVEAIAPKLRTCKGLVLMADRAHMPRSSPPADLLCYEELLAAQSSSFAWPVFDENAASSLCYTSGTTGNPKGALCSHRSTLLHAMAAALPDALNVSATDVVLPVVPMFHVNAWGLAYACPLVGAKLVLPGAQLDGRSLYDLFEREGVTLSAGVPTVWQGLLGHVTEGRLRFSSLKRTVIGGSACPAAMIKAFQDRFGVDVIHAWGMTEMSPLGTVNRFKRRNLVLTNEQRRALQCKQGRAVFGVDMKIVDGEGRDLPWDGRAFGDLLVAGPWVIREYFKDAGGDPLADGWFPTGDVATVDEDGFMQITDRSKDVIKSGGEWISSIEIENVAMAHPAVASAACIAARHPKWDERPLLIVVKRPGHDVCREEILKSFDGKIAKWWLPDDVIFVDRLPIGATGKVLKAELRALYHNHLCW
jgi:fatty-acyl-CoA synthase